MPTHYRGTPQQVLALDAFIKLTRASQALENRLFQSVDMENLTPSQFGVLETLYHLGPLCQGEISARLLKSTGNITLVLDNLEKIGLVRRERGIEDRRKVTLHLTLDGKTLIERVFPRMVDAITAEFDVLTPEEQHTLGNLCRVLGKRSRD